MKGTIILVRLIAKFTYIYILAPIALFTLVVMRVLEGVIFSDLLGMDDKAKVGTGWNAVLGAWWLLVGMILLSSFLRFVNWSLKLDKSGGVEMSFSKSVSMFHRGCCFFFIVSWTLVMFIKWLVRIEEFVWVVVLYWFRDVSIFGWLFFFLIVIVEFIDKHRKVSLMEHKTVVAMTRANCSSESDSSVEETPR